MGKFKIYLISSFLLGMILCSCGEEDLSNESVFNESTTQQTDFDRWLLSNYTYPYNIAFKYKMQDIESSKSHQLVPASPDKCIAIAKLLKYVWIEAYDEVQGIHFIRSYSPKVIHLIGSGGYDSSNSTLLGTAESGMKITLYDVNGLNPDDVSTEQLQRYMKTIFHEFSHILHQNKNYPPEFDEISHSDYVGDDWSESTETLEIAKSKGFVSRYARKETNEDFVEMIAIFVVYGQDNWDSLLESSGPEGAEKINQKFEIIKQYLNNLWSLDIYELQRVFENRLASINSLDLKNL
ncbi:MAG: putative zinc-binding metallopeptidase [Dysgonamonadaceae bacterium]|jgi:substrate import-associated zinc metallohydrolase lipoprotein|nr:putative zinc-binding metallopeptidase [Dysgonamonadaceae bacterium]